MLVNGWLKSCDNDPVKVAPLPPRSLLRKGFRTHSNSHTPRGVLVTIGVFRPPFFSRVTCRPKKPDGREDSPFGFKTTNFGVLGPTAGSPPIPYPLGFRTPLSTPSCCGGWTWRPGTFLPQRAAPPGSNALPPLRTLQGLVSVVPRKRPGSALSPREGSLGTPKGRRVRRPTGLLFCSGC